MNVGNLQSANGRLQEALQQLQLVWASAADEWNDVNSRVFEEEHMRVIVEEASAAIPAISHLAQQLQAAQRELEE